MFGCTIKCPLFCGINNMKNITGAIYLVLIFFTGIYGAGLLLGFWNLLFFTVAAVTLLVVTLEKIGFREEKDNVIVYNPKEWPRYISLGSIVLGGIYCIYKLTLVSDKVISELVAEYTAVLILIVTIIIPVILIYQYKKDRHDFIKITQDTIEIKDNEKSTIVSIKDIVSWEISGKSLEIKLQDETTHKNSLGDLNFNSRDVKNFRADLERLLPKNK
jgi:uncharacterized protein YxeA